MRHFGSANLWAVHFGALLIAVGWAQTLHAAEISAGNTSACALELIGEVRVGDAEQLSAYGVDTRYEPVTMCLNSTGGDVAAGFALFDAFWRSNLSTRVRADESCTDACALAFMGGGDVVGTQLTRQIVRGIEPRGTLVLPALDRSVDTDRFNAVSTDGIFAIPPGILQQLQDGKAFPVDSVGDAVLAGIDVLLPQDPPIRSDQQLLNICDNAKVAASRNDTAWTSAETLYQMVTTQRQAGLVASPYVLGTSRSAQNGLQDLFVVASYKADLSTTGTQTFCVVEFDRAQPSSSYGDPAFSAHRASGVRVALFQNPAPLTRIDELNRDSGNTSDEIIFLDVPRWFALSPDTQIADLAIQ